MKFSPTDDKRARPHTSARIEVENPYMPVRLCEQLLKTADALHQLLVSERV